MTTKGLRQLCEDFEGVGGVGFGLGGEGFGGIGDVVEHGGGEAGEGA
jgi:hypothetical protein